MPGSGNRLTKLTAAMVLGLIASFAAVDFAEARRAGGGGFGSRGARTYSAPAPTRTAPNNAAPIERSMTPNTGTTQTSRPAAGATQNAAQAQRSGGMFGSFGRSMLGGLLVGGLIGMLLGNGLGGLAGMFGLILQVAVIALIAMFVMRMFANRRQPAAAGAGNAGAQPFGAAKAAAPQAGFGGRTPSVNPFESKQEAAPAAAAVEDEPMDVGQEDLDRFEQMLSEIQTAYGREDYAALRKLTTPEAMSYLAEELGEIASSGMRNEVKDVKLLQGDVSEAWREGNAEYATVAIRYSAIDVMLDRNTGAVVEGNPNEPVESVELWTFTRKDGGEWQLAAIQGTE
ncbi:MULTISPECIES: Tim44 domain-containing protein [Brucella/Ochrobactrum group]|uniref:Tim44 domain-containing protein n=1 Tax=Brucella pseudintermedia TaxID=370111 RepID=A0ABY5UDI9_9HYPH|nr:MULTISPECIES: Tim44 domain-containing protein [Brucella/Ochrobactrum group]KAB2685139.1 Tim44 domain-containing protein [Brucella pseudintermedia]NKE77005.1 Tim44 domain-containing protein [Ochrobactrum sp. MC-1LL]TWG98647.1 putative lipid-binding transport protein (Tim44 family) [Ochrobactrum sp. J50]UWL60946.1 Tim44 domain-containing protein [Brucella pseudintermedia]WPM79145.1 Tim44 domain-containing protein [Brucella pseudintermedia]